MVKGKEKGVTLVEVVVAMALIAIVSATIFVTANFSISSQSKNKRNQFFINEAENVLMCYYSDNFEDALKFLTDDNELTVSDSVTEYTLYYTNEYLYTDSENAVYSITIDYSNTFSPVVTCKDSSDRVIYSYGGEENA